MPQNVGSIRDLTAKIYSRHAEFCKADRSTLKITLQDINTTPKEPKTERGRSRDSCFALFGARREKLISRSTISFAEFSVSTQCICMVLPMFLGLVLSIQLNAAEK